MRLVDFDTTSLLPQEKFYAEGTAVLPCHKRCDRMVDTLRTLWESEPKDGFAWEQKGVNSFHLRPAAFEYDDIMLDWLFDNDLPRLMEEMSGRDLRLYHVQIVRTAPGPSYQDWHRDAYQFGQEPFVGAFPPVLKINFYPTFERPEPRLKYVVGSHRCMLNDRKFDEMLATRYDVDVLESSNDRALLFESSLLHGVVPDVNPRGSIRVMYSFGSPHEYRKRFVNKSHHAKLHDLYCERMWPI